MKYWEITADNLKKAGIADAHRGDGKRFVTGPTGGG
jgi:hypothetical protein